MKGRKAARGRPREKGDPKRAEDAVAHMERGGESYAPVNRWVVETVLLVVALLANGGSPSMNLTFFVDGQRSLQGGIQSFIA